MLSRIAESLYWFGRYVERAEDTARILDVHYHLLLEDPEVNEEAACQALLDVMGVAIRSDRPEPTADTVTELLAYDPRYRGSIVGVITAAWENARGARESFPADPAHLVAGVMGWRLRIRHRTGYRYTDTVTTSYNEARMTPLSLPGQTVVDARLNVRPVAKTFRYWDYWGTLVDVFDVHVAHDQLTVTATALVETTATEACSDVVTWSYLRRADQLDRWSELLSPSRYVPRDNDLAADAAVLRSRTEPLVRRWPPPPGSVTT